jgi:hypothetical protein
MELLGGLNSKLRADVALRSRVLIS